MTIRPLFERLCPDGDDLWCLIGARAWLARCTRKWAAKCGSSLGSEAKKIPLWAANELENDRMIRALEAEFELQEVRRPLNHIYPRLPFIRGCLSFDNLTLANARSNPGTTVPIAYKRIDE